MKYLAAFGAVFDGAVVQGSRAGAASDLDIALKVSEESFGSLIEKNFGIPNPGGAKERTMMRAIETGKIQSGEAGLRGLRKQLESM